MHRYPLLWAAVAMIAGGKLGTAVMPATTVVLGIALVLILAAFAFWVSKQNAAAGLFGLTAIFCLGVLHGVRSVPPEGDSLSEIATRQARPIAVRVVIERAAIWRPNPNHRELDPSSEPWRTGWDVLCESVRDGKRWRPIDVRSTLQVDGRIDAFLPGDVVEVYGSFRSIYDATNPGGFDFAKHRKQQGKYIALTADSLAQMSLIGGRWQYGLRRFRGWAIRGVDRALRRWVTHDQAPLASALVFGQREQVDWEDQQELMATGTLHMLAISGMHVEIVAWCVLLICAVAAAGDRVRLASVISVCGLYAALSGGKPPVLRAVVLVAAFETARCLGRTPRLSNLLGFAAMVLFLSRLSNVDNVGVHLSFLAVAAIGVFILDTDPNRQSGRSALQEVVHQSLGPMGRAFGLATTWLIGMFKLSFWVWLITCPIVWSSFHIVAPVAIPLNVVIAVPLAISLLSGITVGLLGFIAPVGWCAGQVCGTCLAVIGRLVELGKAIPFGHLWLPSPPVWWIVCFYAVVALWLLAFGRKRRMLLAVTLATWILVGIGLFAVGPRGSLGNLYANQSHSKSSSLVVTFLDVGHGTSVIIETPAGGVWLYDAGHLGASERSHQEIAAALWEMQTVRVHTLVLSHADADHYNATQGLVERFQVDRIVSTRQFWNSQDRKVVRLRKFIRDQGIHEVTWTAGDLGHDEGLDWCVLHPRRGEVAETDNASSLCLLLEYAGKRILLPGDLEGTGLVNLVQLPERPCHALMAPHHGSLSIDPTELLAWCRPELIVVSGNHRANRPEVVDMYTIPGAKLGITFRDGAIQYRVDASGEATAWHWEKDQWHKM